MNFYLIYRYLDGQLCKRIGPADMLTIAGNTSISEDEIINTCGRHTAGFDVGSV